VAREAMQRIGALYGIEEEIRGKPLDQLRGVRQTQSKPLLDSLRQWLEATLSKLSRKSTATRASNERVDALYRNRHIEIDQQRRRTLSARYSLRRKICLFAGWDAGRRTRRRELQLDQRSAKLNGLDPYAYLRQVLIRIADREVEVVEGILGVAELGLLFPRLP
jgi:transposase